MKTFRVKKILSRTPTATEQAAVQDYRTSGQQLADALASLQASIDALNAAQLNAARAAPVNDGELKLNDLDRLELWGQEQARRNEALQRSTAFADLGAALGLSKATQDQAKQLAKGGAPVPSDSYPSAPTVPLKPLKMF